MGQPLTCKICFYCKISKPRTAFGRRANRNIKNTCLECEAKRKATTITCTTCQIPQPTIEFPIYRRRNGISVCRTCEKPRRGRHSDARKYEPWKTYRCQGCGHSMPPDFFDVKTNRGSKWVVGDCRSCKRAAKEAQRYGHDEDESQLREDVIYDFDLARTMFGMGFEEALEWLLRGYRGEGITETKMRDWGITETRKEVWEPDVIESD